MLCIVKMATKGCPNCQKQLMWYCPICRNVWGAGHRSRHNPQKHKIYVSRPQSLIQNPTQTANNLLTVYPYLNSSHLSSPLSTHPSASPHLQQFFFSYPNHTLLTEPLNSFNVPQPFPPVPLSELYSVLPPPLISPSQPIEARGGFINSMCTVSEQNPTTESEHTQTTSDGMHFFPPVCC
jgi:hypothetical protein